MVWAALTWMIFTTIENESRLMTMHVVTSKLHSPQSMVRIACKQCNTTCIFEALNEHWLGKAFQTGRQGGGGVYYLPYSGYNLAARAIEDAGKWVLMGV